MRLPVLLKELRLIIFKIFKNCLKIYAERHEIVLLKFTLWKSGTDAAHFLASVFAVLLRCILESFCKEFEVRTRPLNVLNFDSTLHSDCTGLIVLLFLLSDKSMAKAEIFKNHKVPQMAYQ